MRETKKKKTHTKINAAATSTTMSKLHTNAKKYKLFSFFAGVVCVKKIKFY